MKTFVMRKEDIQREWFVVDDTFKWWWYRYRDCAAKWFRDRVRGSLERVPDPLV